jgi:hypothetical protein
LPDADYNIPSNNISYITTQVVSLTTTISQLSRILANTVV